MKTMLFSAFSLALSLLSAFPAATAAQPVPTDLVPPDVQALQPAFAAGPVVTVTLNDRTVQVEVDNPDNPLVIIATTRGDILAELFPAEAPQTVANFLGLATGTKPHVDPYTSQEATRPFYDGLVFHRVIDGFMIQGGSPTGQGDGTPGYQFRDEINALSLGLDKMPLLDENGVPHPVLGIQSQQDFQQRVLIPLYAAMGITSQQSLDARAADVEQRLRSMTVKQNFEMLGYRYTETLMSRAPLRGVLAMANSGPDSNGSQFFITLADTEWLTGKHTVFGKVRAGMEVVEAIGKVRVDASSRPLQDITILSIQEWIP